MKIDRFQLDEHVAVVTGASSGIGRAIAIELARAGAKIVAHGGSNRIGMDATVAEIASLGAECRPIMSDLGDVAVHESLVEKAWQAFGQVDSWLNVAGADVLTGTGGKLAFEEKLERLWAVDVRATMRLSRLAGTRMKSQGAGVILNTGWDQAAIGQAGDSGEMFAATKGAIMAFSLSLARSLAPDVRVNCLAPGWTVTAWGDNASPYWDRRARGESLLERWGTPEDVACTARFLVSPAGSFINGQIVPINGGAQPWPAELTRREAPGEDQS